MGPEPCAELAPLKGSAVKGAELRLPDSCDLGLKAACPRGTPALFCRSPVQVAAVDQGDIGHLCARGWRGWAPAGTTAFSRETATPLSSRGSPRIAFQGRLRCSLPSGPAVLQISRLGGQLSTVQRALTIWSNIFKSSHFTLSRKIAALPVNDIYKQAQPHRCCLLLYDQIHRKGNHL